jgi:hypothetical protein
LLVSLSPKVQLRDSPLNYRWVLPLVPCHLQHITRHHPTTGSYIVQFTDRDTYTRKIRLKTL